MSASCHYCGRRSNVGLCDHCASEADYEAQLAEDAYFEREPPDYVEISLLTGRRVRYVPGSEPAGGGYWDRS